MSIKVVIKIFYAENNDQGFPIYLRVRLSAVVKVHDAYAIGLLSVFRNTWKITAEIP